jgi:phage shock protein C
MLAGVAGGLAELWDADPSVVRIVWVLLAFITGGIALVVYIVMAIVVPEEESVWPAGPGGATSSTPGVVAPSGATADAETARVDARTARADAKAARRAARRERRADGSNPVLTIFALALIGGGVFFLVRRWLPEIDLSWFWPVMLIVVGVVILLAAFGRRTGGDGGGSGGTR